ncbi:multidrug resistance-associated protein 14, ATP-binding cassette C10 [Hibiscus trionum]|uniref:ABC-type xenobiotic transporter n=1 Tax=Hibiscus trionum TaxID=183268 RepID=A0A9W7MP61_HIBTR|nr:multidrug resistance-associated protein 14, ATP-binding cassette C10 [Hibiscus trionum]
MGESAWILFCNNSNCSNETGKTCSSGFAAILNPYSCLNHAFIISVDMLLLLVALVIIFCKLSSKKITTNPQSQSISSLPVFSAIYNGILSVAYLALGIWTIFQKLDMDHTVLPMDGWLVLLFQGLSWLGLAISVSMKELNLPCTIAVKSCSTFAFLHAVFLCISSLLEAIADNTVSIKIILDVSSFPGSILFLSCAFRVYGSKDTDPNGDFDACYAPLQGEEHDSTDETSFNYNITPFANAGVLSKMSFWWLNPLLHKGKEKILENDDIPTLQPACRAKACYLKYIDQLSEQKRRKSSGSTSMLSIIVYSHWKAMLTSGFFALIKVLTLSTGPLFLRAFIAVVQGKEAFKYEAYLLTLGLLIAKCLESFSERQWFFMTRMVGLQLRSMLSAAIYQKQLQLSNAAKMNHSPGEIVSYVTVDAYRIGEFPYYFHQIWATSLQFCLALFIVYSSVELATFAALAAIILIVVASYPLTKSQLKYYKKIMLAQDKRLKAIAEALTNMKVLKLHAWETHFKNVVESLRKDEFKWISGILSQKGYQLVLFWSSPVIVPAVTFWTCYLLGVQLNASNVFTFLASLRIVQEPIRLIPDIVQAFIGAKVSLDRIVEFLEAPELGSRKSEQKCHDKNFDHSILIKCNEISWDINPSSKPAMRNIDLVVKPGEKISICGEVGSGKSTLLAAALGEVPKCNGTVHVHGKMAYVSQTAWIQTGSIQENILFGSVMDPVWYQQVVETCCLVKDLEMLPFGDLTEIGERGVNLSGGQKQRIQLARALYQNADIYFLDDPFSAVDAQTATSLFNEYVMRALSDKTVLLVTHQVDFLPAFDSVLLMSAGEIVNAGTYDQLLASSKKFQDLVKAHNNTVESEMDISSSSNGRAMTSKDVIENVHVKEEPIMANAEQLIKQEERETGDTGFKPYLQYLRHHKGFLYFTLAILFHVVFIIGQVIQSYWLAYEIQGNSQVSKRELLTVFTVIGCSLAIFLLLRSFYVVLLGCGASESIFSKLLKSLFRAPMSFYDSTPVGRILSRVSSDLSTIDLEMAFKLSFTVGTTMNTYFIFFVLAVLAWPVAFVIIPMIYLTILLQRHYYASAKELMRINGTRKSSVASHLAESIAGAMTIRAFGGEDRFFLKNMNLIDANASPDFYNFSANEWLIQRLEILCAIVLSSSALSMTLIPLGSSASGLIGMALSYGLSLNAFLVISVKYQCFLSNDVVSVERLEQYMHIPSEAPEVIEANRPPHDWPCVGKVNIRNLKIRYRPNAPLVLHGISCIFEGGSKIGIVGRTGSGKTTFISALFRLVEPVDGEIIIDNLNICEIGLHDLRSHLGIIPQDPTLFGGSVRYNIDPLEQHTDSEIWEVLEKCQLREAVQAKEGGLNSIVVQDGSNWSTGQRQLFCLGRALLKRSRILVLDEATASIDNATDSIIQKTIRTEFDDCTVITVAHRIPTVMDCNMVLGISDGKLVEFDEPMKLMSKEGSLFGQLIQEYWSRSS